MSTVPVVFTQTIPRDLLEAVFKSPRLVRQFEDLFKDVRITLPDAIGNASQDAGSVLTNGAFAPRPSLPPSATAPEDNTQRILAAQIFGA